MINNLTATSPHLTTNSYTPYIGNNGQSAGNMRFNTISQQIEVFDGMIWQVISQNVSVGMTWTAEEAIRWADRKMQDERNLEERMAKHPALKDAYEKFVTIDILTRENNEQSAK